MTEVEQLGIAMRAGISWDDLTREETRLRVANLWLVDQESQKVIAGCDRLGIVATTAQANRIAACFLVPHVAVSVPLSSEEHAIAVELVYRAIKASFGEKMTDAAARSDAENRVKFGETGLTMLHKIGSASGCFGVLLASVALFITSWCVLLVSSVGPALRNFGSYAR